ncbi:hypothetical protein Pla108_35610 [Botrimarina colliarenosi]|uniref:DUF6876 domain-containing protein n=1 Tax=Botrimarina colliarenosi TaxID=2528001 RepID=A0A5C6AAR0_9BACT|nr:DUF6876 family protein [Botrimarina colliarenosi]TWT95413.1 hypothetical protein Pla108_35610 [Botrimarina colliarenosi]
MPPRNDPQRAAKAAAIEADLRYYTGDSERYRHPLCRGVVYTPGVRHLAEAAGAYWLVDAIASWLTDPALRRAVKNDPRVGSLHFWRLNVDPQQSTAVLTAIADEGETPFVTQAIPLTDFPLDSIEVWAGYDGRHWTLYLPNEH